MGSPVLEESHVDGNVVMVYVIGNCRKVLCCKYRVCGKKTLHVRCVPERKKGEETANLYFVGHLVSIYTWSFQAFCICTCICNLELLQN